MELWDFRICRFVDNPKGNLKGFSRSMQISTDPISKQSSETSLSLVPSMIICQDVFVVIGLFRVIY